MPNDPLLCFDNVCFSYTKEDPARAPVISDLSFSVRSGEFIAVVGANGSGKSTLAKLANGLLLPDRGTVRVLGADTADPEKTIGIRKDLGVVFQNPDNQIVASIVEEDVAFGPENLALPREEIRVRVDQALDAVGMRRFAQHETHKLSGGQKQRVAIAGMIAMRPKCLVLDEPTSMLDPSGRRDVLHTLRELNQTLGIGVILITHFMEETLFADRILVMESGSLAAFDTPAIIFSDLRLLQRCSLTPPAAAGLNAALRNRGVPLPPDIIDEAELIDAISTLLQR